MQLHVACYRGTESLHGSPASFMALSFDHLATTVGYSYCIPQHLSTHICSMHMFDQLAFRLYHLPHNWIGLNPRASFVPSAYSICWLQRSINLASFLGLTLLPTKEKITVTTRGRPGTRLPQTYSCKFTISIFIICYDNSAPLLCIAITWPLDQFMCMQACQISVTVLCKLVGNLAQHKWSVLLHLWCL